MVISVAAGSPIPALQLVRLAVPDLAQRGKHAGVEQPEIVEVIAIHALDPHPVAPVIARISQAHSHGLFCSLNKKSPDKASTSPGFFVAWHEARRLPNQILLLGGFGRSSGSSAAGSSGIGEQQQPCQQRRRQQERLATAASAAGAAASTAGAASFFAQAARASATATALIASFMFIKRYPKRVEWKTSETQDAMQKKAPKCPCSLRLSQDSSGFVTAFKTILCCVALTSQFADTFDTT